MTTLADHLPGWFKRKANRGDETPPTEETASTTASVTTGGGSNRDPVVVWAAANVMEAQVVKGRLESEGIPAFIRSEALGYLYGQTVFGLGSADVLVPGPLADKAIDILYADEETTEGDDEEMQQEGDDLSRSGTTDTASNDA